MSERFVTALHSSNKFPRIQIIVTGANTNYVLQPEIKSSIYILATLV